MKAALLIFVLQTALFIGVSGGFTASIDDHFANTDLNTGDSSSGRWTMFLIVNLVIGAAVLYHKRDEIIALWANRNLKVENDELKKEVQELKQKLSAKPNTNDSKGKEEEKKEVESLKLKVESTNKELDQSKKQYDSASKELQTAKKEVENLKTGKEKIEKEASIVKQDMEKLKDSKDSEIKKLQSEIETLTKNGDSSPLKAQLDSALKEKEQIESAKTKMSEEIKKLMEEKNSAELYKNALSQQNQQLTKEKEIYEQSQMKLVETISNLKKEKDAVFAKVHSLEAEVSQLKQQQADPKVAEEHNTQKEALEIKIKNIQADLEIEKNRFHSALEAETKKVQELTKESNELKSQVQNAKNSYHQKQKEYDDLKRESKDKETQLTSKIEEQRRKLDTLEKMRLQELQQANQETSTLKENIKKLEVQVKDLQQEVEDAKNLAEQTPVSTPVVPHAVSSPVVEPKVEQAEEEFDLSAFKRRDRKKQSPFIQTEDEILPPPQKSEAPINKDELLAALDNALNDAVETPEVKAAMEEETKVQVEPEKKMEIPDDISRIVEEAQKKNEHKEEFDLSSLKKSSVRGKSNRIKGLKGINLDQFAEEPKEAEPKSADDFQMPKSAKKRNNLTDLFAAPPDTGAPPPPEKEKVPAFMDLFRQPTASTSATRALWTPGMPVVREYGIHEDVNKRGMRKKRRSISLGGLADMEDRSCAEFPFGNDTNMGLFCVFDGHGGAQCSTKVVDIFPEEFLKQVQGNLSPDLTQVFLSTYAAVDEAVLEYEYEGCTSTTVFVWKVGEDRYLQAANCGDSTAFLVRGDTVVQLTQDHKPNKPAERARILAMGIELVENQGRIGGLAVSRALGDHFLKIEKLGLTGVPQVYPPIKLEPTDTMLVVASDGIWDVLTGEAVRDICKEASNSADMARKIIQTALSDQSCTDNISVIVALL